MEPRGELFSNKRISCRRDELLGDLTGNVELKTAQRLIPPAGCGSIVGRGGELFSSKIISSKREALQGT
jgi:hypothetical protein